LKQQGPDVEVFHETLFDMPSPVMHARNELCVSVSHSSAASTIEHTFLAPIALAAFVCLELQSAGLPSQRIRASCPARRCNAMHREDRRRLGLRNVEM
jgi:hypothetical protein